MKKLIVTALAIGLVAAFQPAAHAQFGSGIVYDPTQSAHAITQIEHEERSIIQPIPADRAGPANLFQHCQDRHDSATGLQRRKAAIQPRSPDDPRAKNALFPVSVSNFRLATATADLEYLRQFDGLAQFGEHRKGSGGLLPASERAEYRQRDPWLQHCQCCRPVADCRAGRDR